jgi:hypothetical protein
MRKDCTVGKLSECNEAGDEEMVMSPLNFFKGSFFDPAFKAKPAP